MAKKVLVIVLIGRRGDESCSFSQTTWFGEELKKYGSLHGHKFTIIIKNMWDQVILNHFFM